jgi:hypothetical protein
MTTMTQKTWVLLGACLVALGVVSTIDVPRHEKAIDPSRAEAALSAAITDFNTVCHDRIPVPSVILTDLRDDINAETRVRAGVVYLDEGYAAERPERAFTVTMRHEAAHVIADTLYGLNVPAHGPEYRWARGFVEGQHQNCRM